MVCTLFCGAMSCLALALAIAAMRDGNVLLSIAASLPTGWFGGKFYKHLSERAAP